jgi:hypothetical protein
VCSWLWMSVSSETCRAVLQKYNKNVYSRILLDNYWQSLGLRGWDVLRSLLLWRSCSDSSTTADGSKYGSTSARCCKYSFKGAPDDGWGCHPKHVELSAEIY